jgi:hypothetical protein
MTRMILIDFQKSCRSVYRLLVASRQRSDTPGSFRAGLVDVWVPSTTDLRNFRLFVHYLILVLRKRGPKEAAEAPQNGLAFAALCMLAAGVSDQLAGRPAKEPLIKCSA